MYEHKFEGDFKAAFILAVDELILLDLPVAFRIAQVELLTEAYREQTEQRPDSLQLERLADFILKDDLSDPHPDKVTNTEYPFLSEGQVKLRSGREAVGGDITTHSASKKYKLNGSRKGVSRDSFFYQSTKQVRHLRFLMNQLED
jgi:hypothetical protein